MSLKSDRDKPMIMARPLTDIQKRGLLNMLAGKRPLPAYMIYPSKTGGTSPLLDGLIRRKLVEKLTTVDGGNRGKGGRIDVFQLTTAGIAVAIDLKLRSES